MKQNKLSMNNEFTPMDILALTSFSNVRSLMDETIFNEVEKEFKRINGKVTQHSTCLTQLKSHDRYVYYHNHGEKITIFLGYWMNSNNEKPYPSFGVQIELNPNSNLNESLRKEFKKINTTHEKWKPYNIDSLDQWCGLTRKKSLQNILSSKNHISEIRSFFIKALNELEEIKLKELR